MTIINEPIHPVVPQELAEQVKAHGATALVIDSQFYLDDEDPLEVIQRLYLPKMPLHAAVFKRIAGHQSKHAVALKSLSMQYRNTFEASVDKPGRGLKVQVHELYSSERAHKNFGAALRARGLEVSREDQFQVVADSYYPYPNGKYAINGDIQ